MTSIHLKTDCGRSPKREFLKDFNIAFAKGNTKFLADHVVDDIVWNIVGDKTIEGKEAYEKAIEGMKKKEVAEITIEKVVSHGKDGAVSGTLNMKNGEKYAFSDFYEFRNTTSTDLKSITSYVIEI